MIGSLLSTGAGWARASGSQHCGHRPWSTRFTVQKGLQLVLPGSGVQPWPEWGRGAPQAEGDGVKGEGLLGRGPGREKGRSLVQAWCPPLEHSSPACTGPCRRSRSSGSGRTSPWSEPESRGRRRGRGIPHGRVPHDLCAALR